MPHLRMRHLFFSQHYSKEGDTDILKRICAVLLALILTGCGAKIPADHVAASSDDAPSYAVYQEVLENKKTVITASEQKEILFRDSLAEGVDVASYSILDMDGDTIPEVVLRMRYYTNDSYAFRVLHSEGDTVYMFYFPFRGLNNLKVDGTHHWSNGAFNNGEARIDFGAGTYTETNLAYCDTDASGNALYYIGDKSVSRAEYTAYYEELEKTPDTVWVAYTPEAFAESIASLTAEPTV